MSNQDRGFQKRRSDRAFVRIPLSISGTDLNGQDFLEPAATEMLSRYGASVVTKVLLGPEQEIIVSGPDRKEIEARVIGKIGTRPEGNLYGIKFLNTAINFWNIDFPDAGEESFAKVLLECRSCQAREVVVLTEIEFEVFQATHQLRRMCGKCRDLTTWRVAEYEPAPRRADRLPDAAPANSDESSIHRQTSDSTGVAPTVHAPQANRRMHARLSMNAKACIKQSAAEDDVVAVTDMGRGGILISSRRVYQVGAWIQIAVPYTPDAANIFVPARIVRRAPDVGEMHQYGIKYVKS